MPDTICLDTRRLEEIYPETRRLEGISHGICRPVGTRCGGHHPDTTYLDIRSLEENAML